MSTMLFGVTPNDPATYITIAVVMGTVAALAAWVPAARAMRVAPTHALRQE
jgi:ABC-type lipoprotein release transport system permease subunit